MEKASKILIAFFLVACAYLAWSAFTYSDRTEAGRGDESIYAVSGSSMEPTLHPGDVAHYVKGQPSLGDIVIFQCHTKRCIASQEDEKDGGTVFIKRLTKIENDCYTFIGDNADHSFDSNDFGALCGNELEIEGFVTSVDFSK